MGWQENIKWKSREYATVEDFSIAAAPHGFTAKGKIEHQAKKLRIAYTVKLARSWSTLSFSVTVTRPGKTETFAGESDGHGNWIINNKAAAEFQGCKDIDILPTPFTNSLPLRRLAFETAKPLEIAVVYIDALEGKIYRARQRYTKMSDAEYKFETVPADFEAVIAVDDNKLVTEYPGLFSRI